MTDATKRCCRCHLHLPLERFSKHSRRSDGLQTMCRGCRTVYSREYRAARPELKEVARRQARARIAADPFTHNQANWLTRARRFGVPVIAFTEAQLVARLSMWAGCWMCGGAADQIDHMKPLCKGGAHVLSNIRPVCGPCNLRKGRRWPLHQ